MQNLYQVACHVQRILSVGEFWEFSQSKIFSQVAGQIKTAPRASYHIL